MGAAGDFRFFELGLGWHNRLLGCLQKPVNTRCFHSDCDDMSHALNYVTEAEVDRRRSRRDHIECLLELAKHLPETDRLLVDQVYRYGIAISDIARLHGHAPRNIRRRVAKLLVRLNSPLYKYVVFHHDKLSEDIRRVAVLVVLHGHSLRRAATISNKSLHRIRENIKELRIMARQ